MSLENLSEEQLKRLASFADKLLSDPETSKKARRLVKEKDPNFNAPDLELEDALIKESKARDEEIKKLREEREADKLASQHQEAEAKMRAAGFDPGDIWKIIKDDRVGSIDVAIELARSRAQAAASNKNWEDNTAGRMQLPEEFKEMQKNPSAWRQKKAHQIINELKGRGAIVH